MYIKHKKCLHTGEFTIFFNINLMKYLFYISEYKAMYFVYFIHVFINIYIPTRIRIDRKEVSIRVVIPLKP